VSNIASQHVVRGERPVTADLVGDALIEGCAQPVFLNGNAADFVSDVALVVAP